MNENNREPLAFQLPDENHYAPPEQVKPIEKSTRKKERRYPFGFVFGGNGCTQLLFGIYT